MAKQNCVNQSVTANGVQVANSAGIGTVSTVLSDGQLLIGATGAAPVAATLTAGAGISITPGSGSLTITNTGGGGGGISSVTGANGLEATTISGAVTVGVDANNPTIASDGIFSLTMDPEFSTGGIINLTANGSATTTTGGYVSITANSNDGTGGQQGFINLFGFGSTTGGGVITLQAQGNAPVNGTGVVNILPQGGGQNAGCFNVTCISDEGQSSGQIVLTTNGSDGTNSGNIRLVANAGSDPGNQTGNMYLDANGSDASNSGNIQITATATDPNALSGTIYLYANGVDNSTVNQGIIELNANKGKVLIGSQAAAGVNDTGQVQISANGGDGQNSGQFVVEATGGTGDSSGLIKFNAISTDPAVLGGYFEVLTIGQDNCSSGAGNQLFQANSGSINLVANGANGTVNSGQVSIACFGNTANNTGRFDVTVNDGSGGNNANCAQINLTANQTNGGSEPSQIKLLANYGNVILAASEHSVVPDQGVVESQAPVRVTYAGALQPFAIQSTGQWGTATLVNGTVTVSIGWVTATNVILCTHRATSGTIGHLAATAGAGSFTITSVKTNNTTETDDQSTVQYWIM